MQRSSLRDRPLARPQPSSPSAAQVVSAKDSKDALLAESLQRTAQVYRSKGGGLGQGAGSSQVRYIVQQCIT